MKRCFAVLIALGSILLTSVFPASAVDALRALERTVGAQGSRSSLITRNETILLFSLR